MRVTIAAVGRLKGQEAELCARYQQRFDQSGAGLALGPLSVIELAESRLAQSPARKADEAIRLKKAVADADCVVALDEKGASLTSTQLATLMARLRDEGVGRVAFVIGGPDGQGEELLARAKHRLSLGALTLPHGLARVIVLEQLYRATTILSGHPYHRP